jgi:hypothetical protein
MKRLSWREAAVVLAAVLVPIPLFAATGLTVPVPGGGVRGFGSILSGGTEPAVPAAGSSKPDSSAQVTVSRGNSAAVGGRAAQRLKKRVAGRLATVVEELDQSGGSDGSAGASSPGSSGGGAAGDGAAGDDAADSGGTGSGTAGGAGTPGGSSGQETTSANQGAPHLLAVNVTEDGQSNSVGISAKETATTGVDEVDTGSGLGAEADASGSDDSGASGETTGGEGISQGLLPRDVTVP